MRARRWAIGSTYPAHWNLLAKDWNAREQRGEALPTGMDAEMLATYQTILEPGDMVILFDTQNTHSLVLRTEPRKGNRPDLLERSYRESLDIYQETYRSLYPDFKQPVSNPAYQPGSQNFWRADGVYTSP